MDSNALNSKFDNLGFSNHLNAINMTEKTDSWCVKLTLENKDVVKDWFNRSACFTTGAYYGIHKNNKNKCGYDTPKFLDYFDYEITTEEFYQKIGLIKEIQYEIC